MSTDYHIYEHNNAAMIITEQSNRFSISGENHLASVTIVEDLNLEDVLNLAFEIFKVASFFADIDQLDATLAAMRDELKS